MSNFLEDNYIEPLKSKRYIEVGSINLPDGTYYKTGGGYEFHIHEKKGNAYDFTFYSIVTNDGIRGSWNHERDMVIIKDGLPLDENVYKIMTCGLSDIRDEKIDKILL